MTADGSRRSSSMPASQRGRRLAPRDGAGTRLLLTVEEAAVCLCVGRTYTFRLLSQGQVRSLRVGKLRRIRPEDLEHYVSNLG